MIFLIFVILFFFILMYGIFSCYRCMVKRDRNQNARRIIQLYQTREWEIRDAQKRVKEIMVYWKT
jgi:cbb3-type cytochrome oxidase subunit 3